MEDGVAGVAMVTAVKLVVEVFNPGTDCVTIHLQSTKVKRASNYHLSHHLNQRPAILKIVQVS